MDRPRADDEPLGRDALTPLTAEEVAALWAEACAEPIPDHDPETLRRFLMRRR